MKLTVSIVAYHSDLQLLSQVLQSLEASALHAAREFALQVRVDVVNNAPDDVDLAARAAFLGDYDGTSSLIRVQLLQSPCNLGYGAGNNLSIHADNESDFHLVLNPDVLLEDATLANALRFMQDEPAVGLVTPRVIGFDGVQQYLCKRNPKLADMVLRGFAPRWLKSRLAERERLFEMRDHDYAAIIRNVSYPTGCFMFFRGPTLRRIGGFDERYFLHYEDADIGRRLIAVAPSAYVPSVQVRHKWSRDTHRSWKMRWVTIRSGLLYFRIWGGLI